MTVSAKLCLHCNSRCEGTGGTLTAGKDTYEYKKRSYPKRNSFYFDVAGVGPEPTTSGL